MIGAKRFGGPDSKSDLTDSAFQNKRVMEGSPFDANRAEPSQRQSTETPTLDKGRAELSRQHVRALNSQFASWVQTQLQEHPDELWEDGAQDYVTHASNIMDKFSDVVKWLKANAAVKEENKFGFRTAQKKSVLENKVNVVKAVEVKSAFFPSDTAPNASTSVNSDGPFSSQKSPFSFGLSPNVAAPPFSFGLSPSVTTSFTLSGPTPFSFGNQSSSSLNQNASKDAADDGEEEPEQPSSPSVKKTEEKGIIVAHEVKCKLYVKSTDPADKDAWKDRGTGQLYIRCKEGVSKGTRESQPNILIRNDVGKVLLNASLYQGIKTSMQKNSIVAIFHTAVPEDGGEASENNNVVARTFLIRIKTEDDRNKLAAVIQEYAPTV